MGRRKKTIALSKVKKQVRAPRPQLVAADVRVHHIRHPDDLATPMMDALEEERRMFLPDADRIARTRASPLDEFFLNVLDKHHGIDAYFDDAPYGPEDF